jgi:hypothetical protein
MFRIANATNGGETFLAYHAYFSGRKFETNVAFFSGNNLGSSTGSSYNLSAFAGH